MPSTIISSDNIRYATGFNDPNLDYQQDGRLWVSMWNTSAGRIEFWYSTDGGETWTHSSASNVTAGNGVWAFFIDKDDYAHLVSYDSPGNDNVYQLGTPSGDHTSFSWSSKVILSGGQNASSTTYGVLAHREGSGWVAHAFTTELDGGGALYHLHFSIPINSSHGIGSPVGSTIKSWGAGVSTSISVDFRHTESDPKAVQSSTPSLYFVTVDYGGAVDNGLLYYKATYSGGSWSWSSETEITTAQQSGLATLVYDGTRVMITGMNTATLDTVRVWERNEANTTTTSRDPPALSLGTITNQAIGMGRNGDVWLLVIENTNSDWKYIRFNRGSTSWGSWTLLEADTNDGEGSIMRGLSPHGLGVVYVLIGGTPDVVRFALLIANHAGEVTMQGVSTFTQDANLRIAAEATLQGVATVSPDGQLRAAGNVTIQGVARLLVEAEGVPFHDFTVYDAYIESAARSEGLLFYDEEKPETVSRRLTPTRQDVGNNPEEIRPEFGDFFAQGDFSHGAGQRYFHQAGRDEKKYWYSEGFDISEPGKLTHLRASAEARDTTTIGRLAQAGDLVFVTNGQRVDRADTFPTGWVQEDPSGADADQDVLDIAAEGARLFAAINTSTAGVRVRSAAGTWSRYQPDGATDLVVGTPTRVAWLKSRLIVIGGTSARSIYEVVADSTPDALETLPEGWSFVDIFEAGGFIHACAVNANAGLSRVHHYGLNSTLSALEKKSSTPWPQGQLMYAGCGFPGLAMVAGGVRNSSGGYDPILYRGIINGDNGELDYAEIRQESGSGSSDLSVRALTPTGETILAGWSLGSSAYGGARDGIAIYHIARDAFAHYLKKTGVGGSRRVLSIMPFKGQVLYTLNSDGLYYEDLANYSTQAILVTSMADWNNAGLKVWDLLVTSHDALASGHSFVSEYTTDTFELNTWTPIGTDSIVGGTRGEATLSNVKSRQFAVRITSNGTVGTSPVFLAYTVRSLPSPATPEFQLTRYIRLVGHDRKDDDAPVIYNDPQDMLRFLQDAIYSIINFYEAGFSWIAWLEDVSTVEPEQPLYDVTQGESREDTFVVRLQMTGTR